MATTLYVRIGERERAIEVDEREGRLDVRVDGESRPVELIDVGDGQRYSLRLGARVWEIMAAPAEGGWTLLADGKPFTAVVRDERERRLEAAGTGGPLGAARHGGRTEVRAPMPGLVVGVAVSPGDTVAADARLLSLEAMKMENEIRATGPGKVVEVSVVPGQKVEQGQVMLVLE